MGAATVGSAFVQCKKRDEGGSGRLLFGLFRTSKARPGGPERSSGQKRVGLNQQCGVAEIGGAGKGNHAVGGWGKVGGVAIERSKGIGQKSIRRRGKQLHGGKLKQRNFWKRGIYFVGGDSFVAATGERAERFLVAVLCCWFGGNPAGGAGGSINFTTRCGFAFHPAGMKRHRHAKRVEQKRQKRQCYGNRAEHLVKLRQTYAH